MDYMHGLNFVGILVTLVVVIAFWIDLRRGIAELKSLMDWRLPKRDHTHDPPHYENPSGGYCFWAYRNGQWKLDMDCCEAGFEAGPPPARKGRYEGEVVKTHGVRRQGG